MTPLPESLHDVLATEGQELVAGVQELMLQSAIPYRDARYSILVTSKPFEWAQLPPAAKPLQIQLRAKLARVSRLLRIAVKDHSERVRQSAEETLAYLRAAIEQEERTAQETPLAHAVTAEGQWRDIMRAVVDRSKGNPEEIILIPDTNALYYSPVLTEWALPGGQRFAVALLPIILTEIDRHKGGDHANPKVTEKAGKIVKQIREFRTRGRLTEGVPLRKPVSRLFAWTSEPQAAALGWLDLTRADDRFLASSLDLAAEFLLSPIAIVTLDQNLQNKCEVAGIHFLDPEEWKATNASGLTTG